MIGGIRNEQQLPRSRNPLSLIPAWHAPSLVDLAAIVFVVHRELHEVTRESYSSGRTARQRRPCTGVSCRDAAATIVHCTRSDVELQHGVTTDYIIGGTKLHACAWTPPEINGSNG